LIPAVFHRIFLWPLTEHHQHYKLVIGLITSNDETAYREEVRDLAEWFQENNLSLNVNKTKGLIKELQETPGGPLPYPHRRDHSGEGEKLQVPRRIRY
jgi:hypothetical protein